MDNFEKVEKLREHANVTYEEAKEALENSNWDILDAMIYLEKNGKTRESQRAEYSTKTERCVGEVIDDGKEERRSNFKDSMHRFAKWCSHILDMGNSNSFCVEKDDKEIFRIPITVLVRFLMDWPQDMEMDSMKHKLGLVIGKITMLLVRFSRYRQQRHRICFSFHALSSFPNVL